MFDSQVQPLLIGEVQSEGIGRPAPHVAEPVRALGCHPAHWSRPIASDPRRRECFRAEVGSYLRRRSFPPAAALLPFGLRSGSGRAPW
jgi:hypothetical protein